MRAVDHDAQTGERHALGQGRLQRLDIALAAAFHAHRAAQPVGRREAAGVGIGHPLLDRELDLVGELVAVGTEQLDAVVLIGIVRGRDHDADVGAQRAGQHGDAGRRQRAEQHDVHAHAR